MNSTPAANGLLIVVGLFLVTSCSVIGSGDDDPSRQDLPSVDFSQFSQAPPLLVGRWELEKSVVYGPGPRSVATPATTGRTETLVFPPPADTIRVYRSDTLTRRTSREAFLDGTSWGVHEDTFATSTAFRDGPLKIYKRVR